MLIAYGYWGHGPYGALVLVTILVGLIAHHDGRRPLPWAAAAALVSWGLVEVLEIGRWVAPALVLVGLYLVMWLLNLSRDDDGRRGRIIR